LLRNLSFKIINALPGILITLVIGIFYINKGYTSYDDTLTLHFVKLSHSDNPIWLTKDLHTLLYNFLLYLIEWIVPLDLRKIHFINLILSLASVLVFYEIARDQITKRVISNIVTAIYGALGIIIIYGVQGRSYALFILMSLISTYYLLKYSKDEGKLNKYLLSSVALMYSHLIGSLLVFIQMICLLVFEKIGFRKLFKILFIYVLALVPIAALLLYYYDIGNLGEIYSWVEQPSFYKTYSWFKKFSLDNKINLYTHLIMIGTSGFQILRSKNEREKTLIVYLFSWMLIPPIILYFKSILLFSVYLTRSYYSSIIPFTLLTGYGANLIYKKMKNKVWKTILLLMMGYLCISQAHESGKRPQIYNLIIDQEVINTKDRKEIYYYPNNFALNIAALKAPHCIGKKFYNECLESENIFSLEKLMELKKKETIYIFKDDKDKNREIEKMIKQAEVIEYDDISRLYKIKLGPQKEPYKN
tara:strand:- start:932 stop:2353 length:1422 start_codon:yes stop_codon:yes gene_type:complete